MAGVLPHPASYRDPSGFIFTHEGVLYRHISKSYKKEYDHLLSSGLYDELVKEKLLIPHTEVDRNVSGNTDWYKTLQPEPLPFISYAYEWSFDMLKEAALLTLTIAQKAMAYGMMLKDATPFNVQWYNGKMIFIDTLSFQLLDTTRPWVAYRQFCESFLAPLALMHYLMQPLQSMLLAYPEGIPLPVAKSMLPGKSKWHLNTYLHLHLHAGYSQKKGTNLSTGKATFSQIKFKNILRSLQSTVAHYTLRHKAVWSDYYAEAEQRPDYLTQKKEIIESWLTEFKPASVFDAGANEGVFSMLAAAHNAFVIAADFDHHSVNQLYAAIKKEGVDTVHPLVMDLSLPSPAIGVANEERASLVQRLHVDLVMALAVIHHLCIGKNIPLERTASFFAKLGPFLLIEFVPQTDVKVQQMLQQKEIGYPWYTPGNFIAAYSTYYKILKQAEIGSSGRVLFLMQRHEV